MKNIYILCELGREITQIILESYGKELAENQSKKIYWDKGPHDIRIRTVYGDVLYSRRIYRTENEDGQTAHVFLLD